MSLQEVEIYTDGACSNNPGPGGWSAILIYQGHEKEIYGAEAETTNNRMELTAAIEGLKALKRPCCVSLYTDSAYLCNGFAKHWIDSWVQNGWKTSAKKPVENKDLWETLLRLTQTHEVRWNKVRGHSDNPNNNRCDELAKKAIEQFDL